jgi:hypothetical protein
LRRPQFSREAVVSSSHQNASCWTRLSHTISPAAGPGRAIAGDGRGKICNARPALSGNCWSFAVFDECGRSCQMVVFWLASDRKKIPRPLISTHRLRALGSPLLTRFRRGMRLAIANLACIPLLQAYASQTLRPLLLLYQGTPSSLRLESLRTLIHGPPTLEDRRRERPGLSTSCCRPSHSFALLALANEDRSCVLPRGWTATSSSKSKHPHLISETWVKFLGHGQLTPWNPLAAGRSGTSVFAHWARCCDDCNMGMAIGVVLGRKVELT